MKILVATDGSDAAIEGAKEALTLLQSGVQVVLAMVIPAKEDPFETATGFAGPTVTEEEASADYAESVSIGEDALRHTASVLAASASTVGDVVKTRLLASEDRAADAIVDEAARAEADLIVIGSSGKGMWKRLFGGSVSEQVARQAPCPVLIIRHDTDDD